MTRAMLAGGAVAAALGVQPAAAQITLGSPGGPPRLELGAGAFDRQLVSLAAQTAGCVVQKLGVATPSAEDLARIGSLG